MHPGRLCSLLLAVLLALPACYALQPSRGGGQTEFEPPRRVDPADVAVPPGFRIETVASGLTFPSAAVFDDRNRLHIVEAGYSYGDVFTRPRLVRIEPGGRRVEIAAGDNPPWTGASFYNGAFYVSEGGTPGRILRITPEGQVTRLVDNLPPRADHFTDRPVPGPDGWIYFGQGTVTNSGVVGADNLKMGWLAHAPRHHDIPCRDITLAGINFTTRHLLQPERGQVRTGAFAPYGSETRKGQVIEGRIPCSGAIFRVRPQGGKPELVAWGLRHPYGLAFAPDGSLYVTDNSYDDRGSRPVFGTGDYLWRIHPDTWYGWPDFAGGRPLNDTRFQVPGKNAPQLLLAHHPGIPPRPVAEFGVHSSSNGLDFSRSEAFGYVGEVFVAQFGDIAPQSGKVLHPVGFRVVRVETETGIIKEFAANKGKYLAPASWLGSGGLERPVDARFDGTGEALYIVDFGVMTVGETGLQPRSGTGAVWRILREAGQATR